MAFLCNYGSGMNLVAECGSGLFMSSISLQTCAVAEAMTSSTGSGGEWLPKEDM